MPQEANRNEEKEDDERNTDTKSNNQQKTKKTTKKQRRCWQKEYMNSKHMKTNAPSNYNFVLRFSAFLSLPSYKSLHVWFLLNINCDRKKYFVY